jgi:hypothetical protein
MRLFFCLMSGRACQHVNTVVSKLFEIRDGKIDRVEAVIDAVPYSIKSEVWDRQNRALR